MRSSPGSDDLGRLPQEPAPGRDQELNHNGQFFQSIRTSDFLQHLEATFFRQVEIKDDKLRPGRIVKDVLSVQED
jgi:hypothetical protein